MKHLLFLFFLLFSLLTSNAQENNDYQTQIDGLAQKVDSLEHELSFYQLSYELTALNTDLQTFANDVYARTLDVRLDIYNQNFDPELRLARRLYYESCLKKEESLESLATSKKALCALKVLIYPFTEAEMRVLKSSCDAIDKGVEALSSSMELLKRTMDLYEIKMKISDFY